MEKHKFLRIVIGSDICPTPDDINLFEDGKVESLIPSEFISLFCNADFSIVNVECPLTDAAKSISKMGPALKASPQCVNFYRKLNVKAACLANNHILDYGEEGLLSTLTIFAENNIRTVGAGVNLDNAGIPLRLVFPCGRSLAVVAMAEDEFSIAGYDSAGANPINFSNYTMINKLKKNTDKVLVILHAGTEMLRIPRPGLIDLCHFLINQGADAVIVQHTHCIGGIEHYESKPIVYGQGNFIFGSLAKNGVTSPAWREGMMVELLWDVALNEWLLNTRPFMQHPHGSGIRLLTAAEDQEFRKKLNDFENVVKNPDKVRQSWRNFCAKSQKPVLLNLMGVSRILRGLAFRGMPLASIWRSIVDLQRLKNMISCESHRELSLDVLKSLTNSPPVNRNN